MSNSNFIEIDDKYVDVDFSKEPEFVFGDTGPNVFGDYGEYFEDSEEIYSEEQIREACELQEENGSNEWFVRRIRDQMREGSCVGQAGAAMFETMLNQHLGQAEGIDISSMSMYKQIGRSASSGASVSDCYECMQEVGFLPLDTPANRERFGDHVMADTGFSTRFPDGWKETAVKFRAPGGKLIRSLPGMKTALAKGRMVQVGREGHSILYLGIRYRNGRYAVPYLNSWRVTWGQAMGNHKGGFGWDTESQIKKSASWACTIDSAFMALAA